jgi:maltose/moltooligosaccharide transporter
VPYILAVRVIPSTRYGVYMGIINMMIVIPMLIQTLTFGWVFENLLGSDASNAIVFAGALLAVAALVMTRIKEPPIVRDVDELGEQPALQPA